MARFTLTHYLIRCEREHGLDWNSAAPRTSYVPGYSANSGSFLVANEFFKVT
jgi:hypothetical protein